MAPPKRTLLDRIADKTEFTEHHHIWTGMMHQRRPHLSHHGNPVRILLNLPSAYYQIRPLCSEPRCVNPHHWRVIREFSRKYVADLAPHWDDPRTSNSFTPEQARDIHENHQMFSRGEMTLSDILEWIDDPVVIKELKRICT